MKPRFLIYVLAAVMAWAEELPTHTMREKLHAGIMASLPAVASGRPADKPIAEIPPFLARLPDVSALTGPSQNPKHNDGPVVMLAPFVVSELKRDRNLEAAMARQTEHRAFSPSSGGTIYSNGRVKAGGWWSPTEGWSFLKMSW